MPVIYRLVTFMFNQLIQMSTRAVNVDVCATFHTNFLLRLRKDKGGSVNEDDDYFSAVRCFDVKTFEFSFRAKLVLMS